MPGKLNKYDNLLQQVNDIIDQCKPQMESVACTTDKWTSRVNDSYLSLTLNFIDGSFRLHRWTPFVKNFHGRHTGANIEAELSEMVGSFKLPRGDSYLCS